jgi:hypothetical protein
VFIFVCVVGMYGVRQIHQRADGHNEVLGPQSYLTVLYDSSHTVEADTPECCDRLWRHSPCVQDQVRPSIPPARETPLCTGEFQVSR